ncbi:MAG: hypothetical protein WBH45_03055 [Acidobacteriaceae bacterium]
MSTRTTTAITNRQSTAIVIITRIHDDFSSMGLTSFHWNGPQVVACGLRAVGPIL